MIPAQDMVLGRDARLEGGVVFERLFLFGGRLESTPSERRFTRVLLSGVAWLLIVMFLFAVVAIILFPRIVADVLDVVWPQPGR